MTACATETKHIQAELKLRSQGDVNELSRLAFLVTLGGKCCAWSGFARPSECCLIDDPGVYMEMEAAKAGIVPAKLMRT